MQNILKKHSGVLTSIGVVLIVLVAAYLRMYKISEYMTFLGDEGRDALIVKHMVVDHKFTLLGPTASVGGFFLGPIYYYFMLPFLWAWHLDPTGPAVMVALFGVATVFLVYKVGKDFFHESVGIIAASLYAVSPIVIAYSRSSWNPNVVPFFSLLLIYLLWRVVVKAHWAELFFAGIILGIGLQLHYLFLFLFIVAGVWLIIYGISRDKISYYLLGLLGFIIGYSPFLAFELRHGFPNTQTVVRFVMEGKDTGFTLNTFFLNINDVAFRLFGRLLTRLPQPERWDIAPSWQRTSWVVGVRALLYSSIGLCLVIIFRHIRMPIHALRKIQKYFAVTGDQSKAIVLLAVWFFVVLFMFGMYKRAIYDYYLGLFFPLPFLFFGLIAWFASRIQIGKVAGVCVWAGLLFFNWQGRPFIYPPNNQLRQARQIAQAAFDLADRKPFNFALIANFNSDHAYRYFFEVWNNKPIAIENEANDPDRHTVTEQLIVICELSECKPLGHPLWEIAGFGRAEIVKEESVSFVKLFKLIHYKETKL